MEEGRRLQKLEEWASETRLQMAVREERDKHVDLRFDRLEATQTRHHKELKEDFSEIKRIVARVAWLVIAGIIAALINFVVQGGLSGGSFT